MQRLPEGQDRLKREIDSRASAQYFSSCDIVIIIANVVSFTPLMILQFKLRERETPA
jgi:hypothetical protein